MASENLRDRQSVPWPILTFNVMTKPGGPSCNLICEYCYYCHKSDTLHHHQAGAISDGLLEQFVQQYIAAQTNPTVFFTWQGGEPTLMGLDFCRRAIALQRKHARPPVKIANAFQTNGFLLDDQWCAFFKEHDFHVGLSIDGPQDIHDAFRRTRSGGPTFDKVRAAVDCLQRHSVRFNTLSTISPANVARADELYDFLTIELGSRFLQVQPCVERKDFRTVAPGHWDPASCPIVGSLAAQPGHPDSVMTDWSISSQQWGEFLCRLFDRWWDNGRETVRINWFDSWASQFAGLSAHMCVTAPVCGRALSIERDGKLYSCDHFVYPEYCVGDLNETSLNDLVRSVRQRQFAEAKQTALPSFCKRCPFLFACYDECPKRRFLRTPDGELGLNYLCGGFRVFFNHAGKRLAEHGQRFKIAATPSVDRALTSLAFR